MSAPDPVMRYEKRRVAVGPISMATVDHGSGDPIVFLHGNPTSSFLWRNVIPHVEHLGRCIAPDLVGFGDSDKLPDPGPGSYRFVENRRYLDELLDRLGVSERVVLVLHDWGSGLGFDWASRHADAIAGIAYLEANVAPRSWSQLTEEGQAFFRRLRSAEGERMALDDNVFIEHGLPGGIIRTLTEEEHDEYRRPFLRAGEDRRPTLTWPREIPFDGEPADVHDIVATYSAWLRASEVPKLLIDVSDGDTLTGELLAVARTFPNQTEVRVEGRHFAQEDSPDEIGRALAAWIPTLDRSR
ncbi:MAG: haloalkane dehalogenase [Actinomycetota bacterium]